MKITMNDTAAGLDWHGMIESWVPGQLIEISDADKKAVAWARVRVGTGLATLVEDAPAAAVKRGPGRPPKSAGE